MEERTKLNIKAVELPQYTEGLLGIMESRKVGLDEALKIAIEDLKKIEGDEHINNTQEAYAYLKSKQSKP